jgi:hypothetical protein
VVPFALLPFVVERVPEPDSPGNLEGLGKAKIDLLFNTETDVPVGFLNLSIEKVLRLQDIVGASGAMIPAAIYLKLEIDVFPARFPQEIGWEFSFAWHSVVLLSRKVSTFPAVYLGLFSPGRETYSRRPARVYSRIRSLEMPSARATSRWVNSFCIPTSFVFDPGIITA